MPLQQSQRSHVAALIDHMLTTGGRKSECRIPRTVALTLGLPGAALKASADDCLVSVTVAEHLKVSRSEVRVRG